MYADLAHSAPPRGSGSCPAFHRLWRASARPMGWRFGRLKIFLTLTWMAVFLDQPRQHDIVIRGICDPSDDGRECQQVALNIGLDPIPQKHGCRTETRKRELVTVVAD